jgi:hypothetical protein
VKNVAAMLEPPLSRTLSVTRVRDLEKDPLTLHQPSPGPSAVEQDSVKKGLTARMGQVASTPPSPSNIWIVTGPVGYELALRTRQLRSFAPCACSGGVNTSVA